MATQTGLGRTAGRWLLAACYCAAGVFHLATPGPFLEITPAGVPAPRLGRMAPGLWAGAAGVGTRRRRRAAGVGLALYAVCVYPANIKHAMLGLPPGEIQLDWWYHAPRLALQPVLVWWALYSGEVTDWPLRRSPRGRIPARADT